MKNSRIKFVYKRTIAFSVLGIVCAFSFLLCCSKPVKRESNVDTPENHYAFGLQKIDTDDLKTAESEFARALELDKDSPMGYTGMAFVELRRSNYKRALKLAKKAIGKDRSFADAYAALGYSITERKHGKQWFDEALKHFEKALGIEPENERAMYYLAESYYKADKCKQALEYFNKTAEQNGVFAARSNKRITLIQKILKAEPLSVEGRIIAEKANINRADLCILLIEELHLKTLLKNYRPEKFNVLFRENLTLRNTNRDVTSEITSNRAKKWIVDIIHVDIPFLNLYPDGRFYPDRLVTKSLMAVVMQFVFALVSEDSAVVTKYIGMASPFDDVNSGYYAFNAINLCIEKEIIDMPENGRFNPDSPVSGIDAILMLRAFEDAALPH